MPSRRNLRPPIVLALLLFAIVGAIVVALATFQVRATSDEIARALPGDVLISHPLGAVNHAITIHRPPREIWPWLVQMGSGRGGWYTYDFIDNRGYHSATQILPAFQEIHEGSIFPALPGAKDVFIVAAVEPERSLALAWRQPNGTYQTTWAFVLEESAPDVTRLIVRGRVAEGYSPYGLPQWMALLAARPAHFIMQRKQLVEIRNRVESRR